MNKTKEYYQKLHEKIAKEHGVSSSYIKTLRSLMGEGKSKQDIIDLLTPLSNGVKKIRSRGKKRKKKTRQHYIGLINWLKQLDEKEEREILEEK